jgi:cytochrome bd-type quinol oxidase subunit 2
MDKKTIKILGIAAAVVAVAVIGYLVWMYVLMDPSKM